MAASTRTDAAAVAASGALLAAGAIPQIITGPLGPYLRLDLGITSSQLGLGLSLSAVPGVVFSVWGGRMTDRIGGIAIGRLTCVVSCLFVVTLSQAPSTGMVRGDPGHSRVPAGDLGAELLEDPRGPAGAHSTRVLAFGIREASLPLLVLVATAVLPVFGDWLGWRTVYAASSIFAVAGLWLLLGPARPDRRSSTPDNAPSSTGPTPTPQRPESPSGDAATLGLSFYGGAGLLMFNLVVFNSFASLSFVDSGSSADAAAALVAASAGGAVLMRIGCSYAVARRGLNARSTLAAMAAAAVVGYLAMATGNTQAMLVGVPLGYIAGWGWTPLLFSYITVGRERSTGRITGVVSALFAAAAIAGPVAAGWAGERLGWAAVWSAVALFSALAAALMAHRVSRPARS